MTEHFETQEGDLQRQVNVLSKRIDAMNETFQRVAIKFDGEHVIQ